MNHEVGDRRLVAHLSASSSSRYGLLCACGELPEQVRFVPLPSGLVQLLVQCAADLERSVGGLRKPDSKFVHFEQNELGQSGLTQHVQARLVVPPLRLVRVADEAGATLRGLPQTGPTASGRAEAIRVVEDERALQLGVGEHLGEAVAVRREYERLALVGALGEKMQIGAMGHLLARRCGRSCSGGECSCPRGHDWWGYHFEAVLCRTGRTVIEDVAELAPATADHPPQLVLRGNLRPLAELLPRRPDQADAPPELLARRGRGTTRARGGT
mmetsp:Transcript_9872/g.24404  ORF Transcript_9872/g.24404 Transcript_9872/m.24404 type:complete len:271 (+) Transcript_9872:1856-2668(+)